MKKLTGILLSHRHAIIWTVCYIFIMKFILGCLFNFDMFSANAWIRLAHSRLYGFGGMVFGILILAALPMYAATTAIILRTKKPLFQIPVPKFITQMFAPPPPPAPDDAPPEKPEPEAKPETFPDGMPAELRGAFMRMRRGGTPLPISAFSNSHMAAPPTPQPVPVLAAGPTDTADDFPIPLDFDTTDDTDAIPSFSDINFDAPAPDTIDPTVPAPTIPEQLSGAHQDGEYIIYKEYLIAIHDDPDFWIADDTDWFAAGKQRPSPAAAVITQAADKKLRPVLYLAETNILDLDARIAQWQSDGIIVITNLGELTDK